MVAPLATTCPRVFAADADVVRRSGGPCGHLEGREARAADAHHVVLRGREGRRVGRGACVHDAAHDVGHVRKLARPEQRLAASGLDRHGANVDQLHDGGRCTRGGSRLLEGPHGGAGPDGRQVEGRAHRAQGLIGRGGRADPQEAGARLGLHAIGRVAGALHGDDRVGARDGLGIHPVGTGHGASAAQGGGGRRDQADDGEAHSRPCNASRPGQSRQGGRAGRAVRVESGP